MEAERREAAAVNLPAKTSTQKRAPSPAEKANQGVRSTVFYRIAQESRDLPPDPLRRGLQVFPLMIAVDRDPLQYFCGFIPLVLQSRDGFRVFNPLLR